MVSRIRPASTHLPVLSLCVCVSGTTVFVFVQARVCGVENLFRSGMKERKNCNISLIGSATSNIEDNGIGNAYKFIVSRL